MRYSKLFIIFLVLMTNTLLANTIQFTSGKNVPGHKLVIAAVGDIIMHQSLQEKAAQEGFDSLWKQAIPYLRQADITYGNLEGPLAHGVSKSGRIVRDPGHRWDNNVYSSFPRFNAHPSLAKNLRQSGFDIVSFANNHSLDRLGVGVDRTIENLDRASLRHVGVRKTESKHPWYTIIEKNGFRIAWIACTQDTNGIRDTHSHVLYCYKKHDSQIIFHDIKILKNKVDAIIVSPHWGIQYSQKPSMKQQHFAKQLLNAGALAVIGSHPHCLQPMQKYITKDGRETFIAYSLGNFISFQGTPKNRATVILYVILKKTNLGTVIDGIKYFPAYMRNRSGNKTLMLTMLNNTDDHTIGYRIITDVLPNGNRVVSKG